MDLDRLKAKLRKFFNFFVAPPKTWRRPNIADILVYDACNSEVLLPCLTGYRIEILHLRGETINVLCLWRAAFTAEFWRGNPIQSYVDAFIRLVQPRLVLTYIDNDPGFYSISKRFATIKTIFVQNGTRGEVGDVFGYLQPSESYHVDYMLVHGRAIGAHYSKFISGNAIAIGSFKNNAVASSSAAADKTILFFSQFSYRPSGDAPFLFEPDGRPVRWDDFHRADMMVLSFLDSWCASNNWQLIVVGRDFKKEGPERDFFASQLRDCRWEYIPRSNVYGSYRLIDAAELVVFIDSTLGYESLARGKRTAAFSCRGWPSNEHAFRFGWPSEMPDSGPFWTNRMDEAEFCRILDYLLVASDHEWERDRQLFSTDLMAYDPGNSLFRSITSELLGRPAPPKAG
jgi:surface carbohydrate biosynthesis protein